MARIQVCGGPGCLFPDGAHCSLELKKAKYGAAVRANRTPFSLPSVSFSEGEMDMSVRFATSEICAFK